MATKNKIDAINDAFITILAKENAGAYERYIKAINREIIDNIDNLTPSLVRSIVSKHKLNIDNFVLLFAVQNAIITLLNKPTKKERNMLLPIVAVLGMYSLRNPNRFASQMIKIVKGTGLSDREKQAREIIKGFQQDNAKVLSSARDNAVKNMRKSILKSKASKNMLKDFKALREQNKPIEDIKKQLVRKYNKLSNVERALDTELHAQSEYVRTEHSKSLGYTHKTWKTQGDERVRHTRFHDQVNNKRVPIDSEFRAGGLRAKYPSDEQLPAGERIRCRCYLVYD